MTATLHDVASAAGVSIKTVSNVVRGTGNFAEQTRIRVQRAIDELGYKPNMAARGLRSGKLGVVGLVVPDIRNPYFTELADAVMRECAEHGLLVVMEQSDGQRATELELLQGRATRMVDGILFSVLGLAGGDHGLSDAVATPVVVLGEPVPGWATDFVTMDHRGGVHEATSLLLASGRRRIAVLGALDRVHQAEAGSAQLRLAGYVDALQEAGVPVDPELLVPAAQWTRSAGAAAARALVAAHPDVDAVVAFNDALALGALRALEQEGVAVPEQVAVVGFDDVEEARYSAPALTTVRPAVQDIAATAVRFLRERIAGSTEPSRGHRATCELQVRRSTSPRASS